MELHSEEYAAMSPTTLEVILEYYLSRIKTLIMNEFAIQAQGLITQQHVTNPSSDTSKKITGE